jgi:hypothetical protein
MVVVIVASSWSVVTVTTVTTVSACWFGVTVARRSRVTTEFANCGEPSGRETSGISQGRCQQSPKHQIFALSTAFATPIRTFSTDYI